MQRLSGAMEIFSSSFFQSSPVTTRMKFWSILLVVALGLVWCSPTVHAKKKKGREQLAVFDSRTIKVGYIQDAYNVRPSSLWVTVPLEGYPIVLEVSRDALKGPEHVEALYQALDCSGSPYFQYSQIQQGKTTAPLVFLVPPNQTVYVAAQTNEAVFLKPQSKRTVGGKCEILPPGPHMKVRPSLKLSDLQDLFVPPFSIR